MSPAPKSPPGARPRTALRKSPRQRRSRHTVQTLLEATAQVLAEGGETALSTDRVARRAGYSIGTLYQYFPGKEALALALMSRVRERTLPRLLAHIDAATRGEVQAEEALRAYLHALLEAFGRGPGRRALARLDARWASQAVWIQTLEQVGAHLAHALRALQDPKLRTPSDVQIFVLTRAVMGAIRAAVQEDVDWLQQPAFEAELQRLAWSMLRREDADGG